ncbi:MAG: hypothetical protein ACRDT6_27080 [Micromonosporaceae bacterium]
MTYTGRAVVPNRFVALRSPDPPSPAGQLYRGAQYVLDRHAAVIVLDQARCSWCGEPYPCSSTALAEQAQRSAMRELLR